MLEGAIVARGEWTVLHDVDMHERRRHVAGPVTYAWKSLYAESQVKKNIADADLWSTIGPRNGRELGCRFGSKARDNGSEIGPPIGLVLGLGQNNPK